MINTTPFKDAVSSAKGRPKGVKVSPDLFRALEAEGLIKPAPFTLWGLQTDIFKFNLPAYDGDIYVHLDDDLDDDKFLLPPDVC